MKYLVVGSGGREHAISYKLSQSKNVEKIYIWPGNDGIDSENKCESIKLSNADEIVDFALKKNIDAVIIGPENYLADGLSDRFLKENIPVFGPTKKSAQLESSKIFAKKLMQKYNVSTAKFYESNSYEQTIDYLQKNAKYPIVIKADGLAAGKGVLVAQNAIEAFDFCKSLFIDKIYGQSGMKVVIEEYLTGFEASIIVLCDGKNFLPLLSAKDHKQVFDENKGLNTGGMGVVAPNPFLKEEYYNHFVREVLNPTFNALKNENLLYKGALFFGIMVNENGVNLLEYNVRFGDPETQAILFSLKNDFNDVIQAVLNGKLDTIKLEWEEGYTCAVILASKGYPSKFEKGFKINGLDDFLMNKKSSKIFFSAVKKIDNSFITDGGRVLSVVNNGKTLEEARNKVYNDIEKITYENMHFRKDIGLVK